MVEDEEEVKEEEVKEEEEKVEDYCQHISHLISSGQSPVFCQ